AVGLLALMLLQSSRRHARTVDGELVLLADQDRALWDGERIERGTALLRQALASRRVGPYAIQAAIAAVHAEAASYEATDWPQIVGLYDVLLRQTASPVVELNRAVALAMREDAATGLAQVDAILGRGELTDYHLAHAAQAELCRRAGYPQRARDAYERALALVGQAPERRHLERCLAQLQGDK